ncbi:DUF2218 domain-containing protein [Phaeobacter sp. B1627]|uniref:DUF2218 domain-containing protein n=1 Tax=Phaeobacter sp. B1627 TaxID=2583809 RepID=UPI0011195DA2|nr:DUF2218 domain-containing protein [Phaeobacter sp. B1627]TNJ48406.1 DUF2218 domain-containing protein [Phaeobacter sp. B1627]
MYKQLGQRATPNASKYLQQLCKHFGHKVDVTFDETQGRICFPFGPVHLSATDTTLQADVIGEDEDSLSRARQVIDSHLERFAFREDFSALDWGPATKSDQPG